MTVSSPGAHANCIRFSESVYALVVLPSVGYCITPSIVTNIFSLFGGVLDRVNSVVDPLPVKLSILLSDISNVTVLLACT